MPLKNKSSKGMAQILPKRTIRMLLKKLKKALNSYLKLVLRN
jgi:hypothetical protein